MTQFIIDVSIELGCWALVILLAWTGDIHGALLAIIAATLRGVLVHVRQP